MTKRLVVVALLIPMLALIKPAPAVAHTSYSFSIGLPVFGAVVGFSQPAYWSPVYAALVYAPPVYSPAPAYVSPPVYGPGVVYAPRRVFVGGYPRHRARYYGPRGVGHRG
jgi:hypothetical protein